jgi:hypothetical protein
MRDVGSPAQNTRFRVTVIDADSRQDQARNGGSARVLLAFSITQRDAVPSAEPDADRKPCAVWLPEGRRRATSPSML